MAAFEGQVTPVGIVLLMQHLKTRLCIMQLQSVGDIKLDPINTSGIIRNLHRPTMKGEIVLNLMLLNWLSGLHWCQATSHHCADQGSGMTHRKDAHRSPLSF